MPNIKGGLGKGLDAIFNENAADSDKLISINLNDIEPNRNQPRKKFDRNSINELAESIKEYGLLQPITVKPMANGRYMIVAGERRWRACRAAGLETAPVIIKDYTEQEVMEVALIENLQRADLNPVEEAQGYKQLMETFGFTQEQVAERVGKSRTTVTNALRLLALDERDLGYLRDGIITPGHARVLLAAGDDTVLHEQLIDMAKDGRSVRDLERTVKAAKSRRKPDSNGNYFGGFYTEVELALTETLHRKVKIQRISEEQGVLSIQFFGEEELREMAARLAGRRGKWY